MELLKLKREISEKKAECRKLINEGNLDEAEALKDEIIKLQLEVEEFEDLTNQRNNKNKVSETRMIDNVILPGEKFEKRSNSKKLRLDKLVRGMAGKGWEGATEEREHYRSMTSATNSTIIPQDLANKIIDVARTNSAIFGRIPTVPMESNNLTIAVQTKDPVAGFITEGDPISESGPVFTKVTM